MAGKAKHAQRAHRSYNKDVDYSSFYQKACLKQAQKIQKKTLGEMRKERLRHKEKK